MEWLTLSVWILVVLFALPAARVPLVTLAEQALCALIGLAAVTVFVASDARAFAWVSFGVACAGVVAASMAGYALVNESGSLLATARQGRKEQSAAFVGVALPFFAVAGVLALSLALS